MTSTASKKILYCTNDYNPRNENEYGLFHFYPFNRPNKIHGEKLAKEIDKNDELKDNPAKCRYEGTKLFVLDGQGRLYAARKLGKMFYYELIESDRPAKELIYEYNSNSTPFGTANYIRLQVETFNSDFLKLQAYLDSYDLKTQIDRTFLYYICGISAAEISGKKPLTFRPLSTSDKTLLDYVADITEDVIIECKTRSRNRGRMKDINKFIWDYFKVNKLPITDSVLEQVRIDALGACAAKKKTPGQKYFSMKFFSV